RAKIWSRSSCVIRPAGPEPWTRRRSMPASFARRRTAGEASGRSPSGRWAEVLALAERVVLPPLAPPHKGEGDSVFAVAVSAFDGAGALGASAATGSTESSPPPCGEGLGVG